MIFQTGSGGSVGGISAIRGSIQNGSVTLEKEAEAVIFYTGNGDYCTCVPRGLGGILIGSGAGNSVSFNSDGITITKTGDLFLYFVALS